jgi:hypothetical protein
MFRRCYCCRKNGIIKIKNKNIGKFYLKRKKMNLTKTIIFRIGTCISCFCLFPKQCSAVLLTGAPFLRISPDARAGGMGDQGVVPARMFSHNTGMLQNILSKVIFGSWS